MSCKYCGARKTNSGTLNQYGPYEGFACRTYYGPNIENQSVVCKKTATGGRKLMAHALGCGPTDDDLWDLHYTYCEGNAFGAGDPNNFGDN